MSAEVPLSTSVESSADHGAGIDTDAGAERTAADGTRTRGGKS